MNKTLQLLRIASLILADDRTITPEVAKEMFLQYKKEHPGTDFINEYDWAESQGLVIQEIDKTTQVDDVALDTADKVQKELLDKQYFDAIDKNDMDKAQKMVDEAAGKTGYKVGPVYHGTDAEKDFTVFDIDEMGNPGTILRAIYFSNSPQTVALFGDKFIKRAYLSIRKPLIHDLYQSGLTCQEFQQEYHKEIAGVQSEIWEEIEESGFSIDEIDGVILKNPEYASKDVLEYIVFTPSQIKSADTITNDDEGNVIPLSQRFNQESDDIRY